MGAYLIRRLIAMLPVLLGVALITFLLFFSVNTPDDVARMNLGGKHVTPEAVTVWKQQHGYDLPLWFNGEQEGLAKYTETLLFAKNKSLFLFDFGVSNDGRSIFHAIKTRMWPSLAIALPTLLFGLFVHISVALLMVYFYQERLDRVMLASCIVLMSISGLFFVIAGQYWLAKILKLAPISGYQDGFSAWRFIILPVIIGVVSQLGSSARWYRTLLLEEHRKEYVKTAFAKGLYPRVVLGRHVLQNALIPIITGVVAILPLLFMGSLIMESFFGIPGLGSYVIDAIRMQDFEIVRSMVFLGTLLYLVGLLMTDFAYVWADPRIRLE